MLQSQSKSKPHSAPARAPLPTNGIRPTPHPHGNPGVHPPSIRSNPPADRVSLIEADHSRGPHSHDRNHPHPQPGPTAPHHKAQQVTPHQITPHEERILHEELELLAQKHAERKKRQRFLLLLYAAILVPLSFYVYAHFKLSDEPPEVADTPPKEIVLEKAPGSARTAIRVAGGLPNQPNANEPLPMRILESKAHPQDAPDPAATQIQRVESGPLLVTNIHAGRDSQGKIRLRGDLFNRGRIPISQVTLRALFPDQDGSPLVVQQVNPLMTQSWVLGEVSAPLEAGTSRSFEADVPNVPSGWAGQVVLDITHFDLAEGTGSITEPSHSDP
ncbi:MAG: hypothetical protein HQL63_04925 [Magnetococcales bacterium]|nr:hypothetical protein [Magnetococcales bacterium]